MASKLIRWVEIDGEIHAVKLKAKTFRLPKKTVCGLPVTRFDLRVPRPDKVRCRECYVHLG